MSDPALEAMWVGAAVRCAVRALRRKGLDGEAERLRMEQDLLPLEQYKVSMERVLNMRPRPPARQILRELATMIQLYWITLEIGARS